MAALQTSTFEWGYSIFFFMHTFIQDTESVVSAFDFLAAAAAGKWYSFIYPGGMEG